MKNYIEREKVFNDLLDQCKITGYGGLTPRDVKYVFSLQTNADVQPVVRGKWIWEENEWQYRCSVCRITFDYDKTYELFDHGYQCANFCPNCGADMRGSKLTKE